MKGSGDVFVLMWKMSKFLKEVCYSPDVLTHTHIYVKTGTDFHKKNAVRSNTLLELRKETDTKVLLGTRPKFHQPNNCLKSKIFQVQYRWFVLRKPSISNLGFHFHPSWPMRVRQYLPRSDRPSFATMQNIRQNCLYILIFIHLDIKAEDKSSGPNGSSRHSRRLICS